MQEFQPLIDEHMEIYEVINKLKTTLESTNKYDVMNEVVNFKSLVNKIVNTHFKTEERILYPRLRGKARNEYDLIDCMLNEHKVIEKKKEIFDDLLEKYQLNPTILAYEALIQQVSDTADMLYNHAYVEDMTILAFAGIVLTDEEKVTLTEELAKIACELSVRSK